MVFHLSRRYTLLIPLFLSLGFITPNSVIKKLNPSNTIIAWDFHHVIAQPKKHRVIKQLGGLFSGIGILGNGKLRKEIRAIAKRRGTGEEYAALLQHYKYKKLSRAIEKISNDQTPIAGTVNIINQLHAKGYKQHMLSDIGNTFLQKLEHNGRFNHIFKLMTYKQSVQYSAGEPHKIVPGGLYFKKYFDVLRKQGYNNHAIIFIDDKLQNIQAAESAGKKYGVQVIGIQFKHPLQLNQQLAQLVL
ncbi:MAG TPA: DUF2608 domain-containing protein [Candidatus Dependentiae bacterium]|nr:DUF2608 domain-containing protein [Candidatus Dependentiae bacterium]HRQ62751.1 DUF2608 domain-containing protein [Candidatus Dependentiae bacterium]